MVELLVEISNQVSGFKDIYFNWDKIMKLPTASSRVSKKIYNYTSPRGGEFIQSD